MNELQDTGRRMVLGLGNTLNRDEGLGVCALKMLAERLGNQADVEFVDGGVLGLNLLPWVEASSHLLVLDAVNARQPPGTLIELRKEQIPLYAGIKLSDHQVTFQEVLGLASFRGRLPEHLRLIGIQPADLRIGTQVSPVVENSFPELIARAEAVLAEWGLIHSVNTGARV